MIAANWCSPPLITDLKLGAGPLARCRYGTIVIENGRMTAVHFRCLPRLISRWHVAWNDWYWHRRATGDRCRLYYDQPLRCSNFLALKLIVSDRDTSYRTLRASLIVLDEIARLKRSDAIVCDVCNPRLSDRLLERLGWEPHAASLPGRHYIRRFYDGDYGASSS